MITPRRKEWLSAIYIRYLRFWLGRNFKEIIITPFEPRAGHSVLMMSNHFSWWDMFLSNHTAAKIMKRRWYVMMQHENAMQYRLLRYIGVFSIVKGKRQSDTSLAYGANLLNDSRTALMICPQGEIRSNHETYIDVKKGTIKIIDQVKGPCQVVYHCVLIDYFESLKPRAYIHLFDCGNAGEFTLDELRERVNNFHQQALITQINMEH